MDKQIERSFFPDLEGEERDRADKWLLEYVALVLRIQRESRVDDPSKLSTAEALTDDGVPARSVRLEPEPPVNSQ